MKIPKLRLLQWLITSSAVGLLSFYGINTAVFETPEAVSSGSNEYKFKVTSLAPLTGGTNPDYRIVVYHGDGNYFMGTKDQLDVHQYAYTPGIYYPMMEVIARYDDGSIPPKRMASPQDISVTTSGTAQLPDVDMNGNHIMLQSTCSAVPGDLVTFIITYDLRNLCASPATTPGTVSGRVKLRFNDNVFNFNSVNPNPGPYHAGESTAVVSGTSIVKTAVCTLTNLSTDRQRNLFFLLETKDGVPVGTDPMLSAELEIDGIAPCRNSFTDDITGYLVRDSHDPNYKEIISNDMCDPEGDIEWRIHFQNEGNGIEDSVWITDWIDTLIDFNSVGFINGEPSTMIVEQWKRPGERTVNCLIRNINLRGLGERSVDEALTRGYITLKANKRLMKNCNAFVNRARIRFGFKPPIETAEEFAFMPCSDVCDSCFTALDTLLALSIISVGDSLFSDVMAATTLFQQLQNASYVKWYPTDGLSNPLILNPKIEKTVRRTYTLVASGLLAGSCTRMIIRVPVDPGCSLALSSTTTLSDSTTCLKPNWDLTAIAVGAPPDHLMWHTGNTGVDSYSINGLAPGLKYIGVWDTLTGCSAETWVRLNDKCSKKKSKWPWEVILVAALAVVIGFTLYKFIIKK